MTSTSFPIWIPFIFFFLIAVAKTSKMILILMTVGILVLFLILEEMLSVIYYENNVCFGTVVYGLYYVEVRKQSHTTMQQKE